MVNQDHGSKKATVSSSSKDSTVYTLVAAEAYPHMDSFLSDIDRAIKAVTEELRNKSDANAMLTKVTAFRAELDRLLWTEMIMRPDRLGLKKRTAEVNLNEESEDAQHVSSQDRSLDQQSAHKKVLTLFGTAPHPRQLFSSFQIPRCGKDKNLLYEDSDASSMPALRERALPNGISLTTVVPIHSFEDEAGENEKTKGKTLGELLPQPSFLPQLNPPRQSKHTATRSSSVNWFNPSDSTPSTRSYRRETFVSQPLSTGQWLTYNVAPSASKLSSPEAKRKQRDRALSFGESQTTLPQETMDAHAHAKEDALFRSAFSSFAPDTDNTGSIVNARAKSQVWWDKVHERRYQNYLLGSENDDLDDADLPNDSAAHNGEHEMKLFEEAVASWSDEELPPELKESEKTVRKSETTEDIDDILREISEALETLNSHQRVRNLSLAAGTRPTTGPNPQLSATSRNPNSPSADEYDIYEVLKSQLALMVAQLPPYALARLDGDKLAELNVSAKIQALGKSYKGTMEEDDVNAKVRQIANTSAYPIISGSTASTIPSRSNLYSSTPSQPNRSNYATQPSTSRQTSSYLPNQQYSNRPISSNQYFGSSSSTYANQQRTPVNSDRYPYGASQQYNQRPAQSSQSSYANGYRSYSGQNTGSYGQQYGTPSQSSTTQRPGQTNYQQRGANPSTYNYGNAAAGRSGSPQQNTSAFTPQQRSSYAANNPQASQHRPSTYQYNHPASSAQQVNGTGSDRPANQSTYATENDPAALISRQKAQLAEKQSQTPARQASGTPQPANGTHGGQVNGISPPSAGK